MTTAVTSEGWTLSNNSRATGISQSSLAPWWTAMATGPPVAW